MHKELLREKAVVWHEAKTVQLHHKSHCLVKEHFRDVASKSCRKHVDDQSDFHSSNTST